MFIYWKSFNAFAFTPFYLNYRQIYNLLVLCTLSYIAILTCSPNVVQRVVLFVALMYLSYLHLLRLFHDYGGYTIDITGFDINLSNFQINSDENYLLFFRPIMIAVQKVTNVGFSLHDGMKPEEELTADQKRYAIRFVELVITLLKTNYSFVIFSRKRPTFLEFYSYVFQFPTLMCGPLVFFNDYIEYIYGKNFDRHLESSLTRSEMPSPLVSTRFH